MRKMDVKLRSPFAKKGEQVGLTVGQGETVVSGTDKTGREEHQATVYGNPMHRIDGSDIDPIASGLRQLLVSVSEEPIPEEFMQLLDRLDESAASGNSSGQSQ